jgi:hypothetical protein
MANDLYTKELKKILADTSVPGPTALSRTQIEAGILEISDRLKGSLNNVERLWLVEDRQHLRKQLALVS